MSVEVVYEDKVLCAIIIDGERFDTEDDNLIIIPIRALLEQKIDDFPQGVIIELCDDIS